MIRHALKISELIKTMITFKKATLKTEYLRGEERVDIGTVAKEQLHDWKTCRVASLQTAYALNVYVYFALYECSSQ